MALRHNKIRDEFGWADEIHYPLEMTEYLEHCEHKLRDILRELHEKFGTGVCTDLKIEWERTRFDLVCTPIEKDEMFNNLERHFEISRLGYVDLVNERIRQEKHYDCIIYLIYDVQLHWLKRPGNYTNYYSVRFMDKLKEAGINFTCEDIKWISDESNGQMFGERFKIDFSKEISEEHAHELCDEFNRLNKDKYE